MTWIDESDEFTEEQAKKIKEQIERIREIATFTTIATTATATISFNSPYSDQPPKKLGSKPVWRLVRNTHGDRSGVVHAVFYRNGEPESTLCGIMLDNGVSHVVRRYDTFARNVFCIECEDGDRFSKPERHTGELF